MKRRTYTVSIEADKLVRCSRCGRATRTGQRVTATVHPPNLATYTHAGRVCPPTYPRSHP